jgi:hypothetical protein
MGSSVKARPQQSKRSLSSHRLTRSELPVFGRGGMRLPLGSAARKHSGLVIQAGGRRTMTTGRHVPGASTLSSASVRSAP